MRVALLLGVLFTTTAVHADEPKIIAEVKGYIVPVRKAQLTVRVPGEVGVVHVQVGDQVKSGDQLLRLDPAPYERDLQRVEIGLQAAENRLRALTGAPGNAPELDKMEAKTILMRAQADRDMARYRLDATSVRAPFDGTILSFAVQPGDSLRGDASTRPIITIADLKVLEVEVEIPEAQLSKISVNQPCRIQLLAYPELKLTGQVARIIPHANRDRGTVPVRVLFKAPEAPPIYPDLSATVSFLEK